MFLAYDLAMLWIEWDFNVPQNFQSILTCFGNNSKKLSKQFSVVYINEHIPPIII